MDRLTAERMAYDAAMGYGTEADIRQYVQQLANEVLRLREEARWIPVTERLPEREDGDDAGNVEVWYEDAIYGKVHFWMFEGDTNIITHWRPMPQGPEVER